MIIRHERLGDLDLLEELRIAAGVWAENQRQYFSPERPVSSNKRLCGL